MRNGYKEGVRNVFEQILTGLTCDVTYPVWRPGKTIVPLQPKQVVKGDQNEYPVPGDIVGLPCPRGYKYGGMAVQVGGWATGDNLSP